MLLLLLTSVINNELSQYLKAVTYFNFRPRYATMQVRILADNVHCVGCGVS